MALNEPGLYISFIIANHEAISEQFLWCRNWQVKFEVNKINSSKAFSLQKNGFVISTSLTHDLN